MMRESMNFDVVIVGAGPAGLSAGIRLAQLAKQSSTELSICIIDKAERVGGQVLSGAVLEPRALNELIPNWQTLNPPMHTPAKNDYFLFLTEKKSWRLPTPPQMKNHGNFIISLEQFTQFLAQYGENLGINIFPGFAAADYILENNQVVGVITGDKGLDRQGGAKSSFQPGMELRAKHVILAEGCRGSLTKKIMAHFNLNQHRDPQTYGLGLKEIWEIPETLHQSGKITHSVGWPLDYHTYGGSFAYHFGKNLLSIGFVIGLDYQNPFLNPYEEFQKFKLHPSISYLLENGKRIAYGARTLIEGGLQSLPTLTFPGGLLVGDAAGFLNVPKIKGIHTAMKSGMLAAESIFERKDYLEKIKQSWVWEELYKARNIRPAMSHGLIPGLIYSGIDTYLLRGRAPWTFHHKKPDHDSLKKAAQCKQIHYPKHDNKITFDLSTSLYLTHIQYDEHQPCHLKLTNPNVPVSINLKEYAGPEQRYCPAGVYEFVGDNNPHLQINAPNCIHCKACDIKDPTQNITWTTPEGGSGPDYDMM